jgi:hypothetical protein
LAFDTAVAIATVVVKVFDVVRTLPFVRVVSKVEANVDRTNTVPSEVNGVADGNRSGAVLWVLASETAASTVSEGLAVPLLPTRLRVSLCSEGAVVRVKTEVLESDDVVSSFGVASSGALPNEVDITS